MPDITRRVGFYASTRRRVPKTLHIETDGAVINITVGLTDSAGRYVTNVSVSPDDERRGGDGEGRLWTVADANEHGLRLVRLHATER